MTDALLPCRWTVTNSNIALGETGDYEGVETLLCDGEVVAQRWDPEDDHFEEIAEAMNRRAPSPKLELPQEVRDLAEAAELYANDNNCFDNNECYGECVQSAEDGLHDAARKYAAFIRRIAGKGFK